MKISEIKVKLFADHVQDLLLIRVKGGGSVQPTGCIYRNSKNLTITMTASREHCQRKLRDVSITLKNVQQGKLGSETSP